jgi:hypothetical protein
MFEGEDGRLFVNRGVITGRPIEELKQRPFGRDDFRLYEHDNLERPERAGKIDAIKNHMGNFYDCTRSRRQPISDVASQHRSATLCHLGTISQRLGRPLRWDPQAEQFVDDADANKWLRREQRAGFEIA